MDIFRKTPALNNICLFYSVLNQHNSTKYNRHLNKVVVIIIIIIIIIMNY